jgi:hypothetical protein
VKGGISDRSADSGAPRGRWQQPLKRRAEVKSPEQTMGGGGDRRDGGSRRSSQAGETEEPEGDSASSGFDGTGR